MTTTDTLTLTQFLEQCIAADEAAAQAATSGPWTAWDGDGYPPSVNQQVGPLSFNGLFDGDGATDADAAHVATHDPARVLRQCAAFREIVAGYETYASQSGAEDRATARVLATALRFLATIYADRPGWQEAWV